MMQKEKPVYSVIVSGKKLKCINTASGSTFNIKEINGDIVLGPIVTGDRCVVVYKAGNTSKGAILRIPSLSTITTFKV